MNLLKISDPRTLIDIEKAISKICENKGKSLQLPIESISKRRGAIHDAARLQMLVTWARYAGEAQLNFHQNNNIENVLKELGDYSTGIAAVRLTKGVMIGDILKTRREALSFAVKKMQETDNENLDAIISGRTIDIICVSGSQVQFIRPLFSAKNKVKDDFEMQGLINRITKRINQGDQETIPDILIRSLGVFMHELFLNTQEHATSDYKREPYSDHVEGMFVSWIQIDDAIYSADFKGHNRLAKFWSEELSNSGDKKLRCLQISFFDSGSGFASRAIGKPIEDIDLKKEREILINCLNKNTTSKNQVGAGNGLPRVLKELKDISGMIRIRSGRHAIFNAFPLKDESIDLLDFQDWSQDKLACVAGAVISILIPLRRA